jgi:hypothetical protein
MNQQFDSRIRILLVMLAVSAYATLAGCYTVIKHPPTAEVADGGEARTDCYSCHGPGGDALAYDPLYAPGFDYYPDSWYGYYAYPWWWREFWHDDIYDHGSNVGSGGGPALWDDDLSRRRLWGRGPEYMPPQLPPLVGAPSAPAAPGSPAEVTQPPKSGGQQQPGRSMKNDDGDKPIPNPTPGPTPPPTPTPTPSRETKQEPSKDKPPEKQGNRKDDGGGS